MKKLMIVVCFFQFALFAQKENEQKIKSEIAEVKVFLTSGKIYRQAEVFLKPGRNKLIFTQISTYADPQSIQFSLTEPYKLVSVSTEMDFLAAEQINPRIKELKDSLDFFMHKQEENQDMIGALNAQKGILSANQKLNGEQQKITVEEIKAAADFYKKQTLSINQEMTALNRAQQKLNERLSKIRMQLVELNFKENARCNQVVVLVDIDKATKANASLDFIVSDCGWSAIYDLEAQDTKQAITLKYKAQVYNNTGNDWNNVKLTLSTADPRLNASHPELVPWYLSNTNYTSTLEYKDKKSLEVNYQSRGVFQADAKNSLNIANQRVYDEIVNQKQDLDQTVNFGFMGNGEHQDGLGNKTVQFKEIEISELTAEFPIAQLYSLPTDGKPYVVEIKTHTLNASFSHIAIPKLDRGAFLLANISGWQNLDLMPGKANVYFGGNYVGQSTIDTRNVGDTLSLSFGRDAKVSVNRELKEEFSNKKIIGNNKRDTYSYALTVKNNKTSAITMNLFDQVPISQTSDILVTTENISGGTKNETTGEVQWNLSLQPGESKTVEITFSIKYPKTTEIQVKRYRTISAPSF